MACSLQSDGTMMFHHIYIRTTDRTGPSISLATLPRTTQLTRTPCRLTKSKLQSRKTPALTAKAISSKRRIYRHWATQ